MNNNLWAPWRGAYVTGIKSGDKSEECVLCAKLKESSDKENYLLHRGKHIFVIMNLYPYNNGHIMLLPNRHVADITELSADETAEMSALMQKSILILRKVMNPGGFNIGYNMGAAAGAGIAAHLHQHIVPRWNGDTNFMPVLGEIKVISESMDVTYDKLKAEFIKI